MLIASVIRNIDDATHWLRTDQRAMEFIGNLALNIFLTVALMDLKLWQLAGVALPLVGVFFIDFTNAIIITFFLNWLD